MIPGSSLHSSCIHAPSLLQVTSEKYTIFQQEASLEKISAALLSHHAVLILILGATCLGIVVGSTMCKVPTKPERIGVGGYRPDIDGLRAVAVIAVVIYHLNHSWLPGGFLGVDIFFVISGYVVTGTILRHPSSSFNDCMTSFYVRRIKRIAPNLNLVVIVTGTLMAILMWPLATYQSTLQIGASALFGCSNIFLWINGESYFDDPAKDEQNQFLHTWSLGVEEQFYMIYPIVLLIAYGMYQNEKEGKACLGGRRSIMTWSICILASFFAQRFVSDHNAAFYLLPFRFWQLAMGAFLLDTQAIWSAWVQHWQVAIGLQLMAAVLIIVSLSGLVTTEPWSTHMPGLWMSVLGAVCYIMAGSTTYSSLNRWLSKDLPVYIGNVSYSFYLWHWPVIALSPWFLPKSNEHPYLAGLALPVLLTMIAGIATFSTVERAFRMIQNPRPPVAFGVFFLAACVSLSWLLALGGPLYGKLFTPIVIVETSIPNKMLHNSLGPPQCWCAGVTSDDKETTDDDARARARAPAAHGADKEEASLPACMWTPQGRNIMSVNSHELFDNAIDRCELRYRGALTSFGRNEPLMHQVAEECLVREMDTEARKLYLFGDSHARALVPGFRTASAANKLAYRPLTAAGYSLATYLGVVLPILEKQLHAGDVVVSAHATWNAGHAEVVEAVTALFNLTSARQAHMVLVGDHFCDTKNNLFNGGPLCLMDPDSCSVPRQSMQVGARKNQEAAGFKNLSQTFDNITVIDLVDTLCSDTACSPFIPSTNLLGVSNTCHFSKTGSYYLWPKLCNALSTLS